MVYDERSHTIILVRLSYSYITCVEGGGLATQLSLHILWVNKSLIFWTLNTPYATEISLILVVLQMNIVQVMNIDCL